MKKIFRMFVMLAAAVPVWTSAIAADEVITTPPAGREVECYADFLNQDNVYGFMGDYHSLAKIVYTDDGKAYIPNVLMRNTMKGYVVGTVDETAKTVTVEAGQVVYVSPNIADVSRLYMLNGSAVAGDVDTGKYFTEPLVFDMADDGTLTLRQTDAYPMFGIAGEGGVDVVYAIGANLQFVPVETTTSLLKYYNLHYTANNSGNDYDATITSYKSGDDVWFKGFDPRYPDAWIKATWVGEELRAGSFQVLLISNSEIPTVMAASKLETGDDGSETYVHYNFLPIVYDKTADTYTACKDDGMLLTNLTSYDETTAEVYQVYSNITISPLEVSTAIPVNPVFDGYDPTATSKETELKFYAYARGTNGETLLKDALALRYYVNDEVYVFHKADYTRLDADMELIPFTFNDNNTFIVGSDGEKHYTYFLNAALPGEVKTIGVEVLYTVDGVTTTSERLVYDVATGKADYVSGLQQVADGRGEAVAESWFDVSGRAVSADARGLLIKVVRYADGHTETVKVAK